MKSKMLLKNSIEIILDKKVVEILVVYVKIMVFQFFIIQCFS